MKVPASVKTTTLGLAAFLFAGSASATISFDQNVTSDAIFGSGNANGSFTVDRANGVELGLRGKLRHNSVGAPVNTFNSNGDGTYSFDAGVAPTQTFPTAVWSVEWSINTNFDGTTSWDLNDLTYQFGRDSDPSEMGQSFVVEDIINVIYADHSIGNNMTGNGAGTEATTIGEYASLIDENNVAQNSWKAHWILDATFDPTVNGTYDFFLAAFDGSTQVARTNAQIIVTAVPEPGSFALLALGLMGLGFARRL